MTFGGRVYDSSGNLKVIYGELLNGNYGFAAVNSLGQLVELDTISFGQKAAYDSSADSTTSIPYVGLGGPSASSVLVGATGRCKVTIGCQMDYNTGAGGSAGGAMSLTVSGATVLAASNEYALVSGLSGVSTAAIIFRSSYTHLFTGLTPGLHTFTAVYRSLYAPGCSFADRTLIAEPF